MNKKDVILCVDDEQIILNSLSKQLVRRFGARFEYEFAESAEEGLEIIDEMTEAGYNIVMVISDQIMPGMAGDEFLIEFHRRFPKSIKILLTGQAAIDSAMNAVNKADLYRYLTKPWNEEDFLITVDRGLQQYYLHDKASVLLAEVHHRVKNNLTIISCLLELQISELEDDLVKMPFQQSINRINSIAKVHELIYDSEDMSSVNIKDYLERIIPAIQNTMQDYSKDISIKIDIPDYRLKINQAVPLGLLFNELLTNSYKYAFNGRDRGKIVIKMEPNHNFLKFTYKDDGVGFQEKTVSFENSTNLGLTLINLQLQQLECTFKLETVNQFNLQFEFEAISNQKDEYPVAM